MSTKNNIFPISSIKLDACYIIYDFRDTCMILHSQIEILARPWEFLVHFNGIPLKTYNFLSFLHISHSFHILYYFLDSLAPLQLSTVLHFLWLFTLSTPSAPFVAKPCGSNDIWWGIQVFFTFWLFLWKWMEFSENLLEIMEFNGIHQFSWKSSKTLLLHPISWYLVIW